MDSVMSTSSVGPRTLWMRMNCMTILKYYGNVDKSSMVDTTSSHQMFVFGGRWSWYGKFNGVLNQPNSTSVNHRLQEKSLAQWPVRPVTHIMNAMCNDVVDKAVQNHEENSYASIWQFGRLHWKHFGSQLWQLSNALASERAPLQKLTHFNAAKELIFRLNFNWFVAQEN